MEVPLSESSRAAGIGPRDGTAQAPRSLSLAPQAPPQRIAAQLLALAPAAGGSIEIALHPEELGRLRVSVAPQEGGHQITILAERPEALDTLRRHADVIAGAFRDMGYGPLDLDMRQGGGQPAEQGEARSEPGPELSASPDAPTAQSGLAQLLTTGLDLRL